MMRGRRNLGATRVAAATLIVGALWTVLGQAQTVPPTLTEQGRLTNSTDKPITTATMLTFNIYNVSTGGTSLWTETQTITPDQGYFSAELGSVTAFPGGLFNGAALYLGVTVGTDPEMTPRQSITSVPYAFVSQNAIGDITPNSVTATGALSGSSLTIGGAAIGGIVETLSNESFPSETLSSCSFDYVCQTASYTPTTAGQTAIIWSEASVDGVPVGSGLGVRAAYNVGGVDATIGSWHYMSNEGSTSEGLKNSKVGVLALINGTTYTFETAMNDSQCIGYGPVSVLCNTVVEIVAAPSF